MAKEFTHGTCDLCADGCGGLMCAIFCGPCYTANTRTIFDESNCFFNLCCLTTPATYNIIREGYGINGSCCGDILSTCLCPCCSAIQLRSEVNERGAITKQKQNNSSEHNHLNEV